MVKVGKEKAFLLTDYNTIWEFDGLVFTSDPEDPVIWFKKREDSTWPVHEPGLVVVFRRTGEPVPGIRNPSRYYWEEITK